MENKLFQGTPWNCWQVFCGWAGQTIQRLRQWFHDGIHCPDGCHCPPNSRSTAAPQEVKGKRARQVPGKVPQGLVGRGTYHTC